MSTSTDRLREGVNAAIERAGTIGLSRVATARAQRYVVAHEAYRPFRGLPDWLRSRTDSEWFVARIAAVEHDVHEHKLFDIREPALLEHGQGFVFLRSGWTRESLTYWQLLAGPSPRAYRHYLRWRSGRERVEHLPVAVSLRARWEGNFWHCQDNVLSKLMAVDRLDLPDDVPLLVGKAFWTSPFFADIRPLPAFRHRNWVLHDRPIATERVIVCLEGSFRRSNMVFAQQNLDRRRARRAHDQASRRPTTPGLVVLSRRQGLQRYLENGYDVASRLARAGFSEIDAEQMSLDVRLATFRNVRAVVLPIGAGLANLVHRIGEDCAVVEIIPADDRFAQPYGAWLCREFGFSYRAVVGSAVSPSGSFIVDSAKVVDAVTAVLREQQIPEEASADTEQPQSASAPRSTGTNAPWMARASSDATNATTAATSSGEFMPRNPE